eukprot:m.11763 g.11763  ORF g.11763 m.11763 type:complete len:66 (+) comp6581_c0_seq1:733-930(+)
MLVEDVGCIAPVFVDTMSDAANKAYAALFERLYLLKDGVVMFQGGKGPDGYFLSDVEEWLREHPL